MKKIKDKSASKNFQRFLNSEKLMLLIRARALGLLPFGEAGRGFFFFFLFLFLPCFAIGQNDLQFSHFMYNENIFNPAATGNSDKIIASLVARQQWMGVNNPPSTQFLNIHAFVNKIKGGLGLTAINDKVGFENTLNLKLNYAYHLRISETSSLSAGLSAGFINKKLDGSKLIYEQGSDPHAVVTGTTVFSPDFGGGIEFKTSKITAGASSTHISNSLKTATVFDNPRHYFLYAKYKINLDTNFTVTPAILVKSSGYISQLELNATAVYKEKISLGITYRYKESIVGLVGVSITDALFIGYSYDYNAKPIKSYSSGSHEIMIQARLRGFNNKKQDYKSVRFF